MIKELNSKNDFQKALKSLKKIKRNILNENNIKNSRIKFCRDFLWLRKYINKMLNDSNKGDSFLEIKIIKKFVEKYIGKTFNKNNEWESYFIRAMWNKKNGRNDKTKKFIKNYKMIFDYFEKNNIFHKQVKLFFKRHGGFNKSYKFIKTQIKKQYIKNVPINNNKNEIIVNLCEILSLIIYNISNKLCKNNDNFNNIEKLYKETMYMIYNK